MCNTRASCKPRPRSLCQMYQPAQPPAARRFRCLPRPACRRQIILAELAPPLHGKSHQLTQAGILRRFLLGTVALRPVVSGKLISSAPAIRIGGPVPTDDLLHETARHGFSLKGCPHITRPFGFQTHLDVAFDGAAASTMSAKAAAPLVRSNPCNFHKRRPGTKYTPLCQSLIRTRRHKPV